MALRLGEAGGLVHLGRLRRLRAAEGVGAERWPHGFTLLAFFLCSLLRRKRAMGYGSTAKKASSQGPPDSMNIKLLWVRGGGALVVPRELTPAGVMGKNNLCVLVHEHKILWGLVVPRELTPAWATAENIFCLFDTEGVI